MNYNYKEIKSLLDDYLSELGLSKSKFERIMDLPHGTVQKIQREEIGFTPKSQTLMGKICGKIGVKEMWEV